jgi:hypothetical protein
MTAQRRREAQAIFFRRRHQPRRPPLAKIRPGRPGSDDGAGNGSVRDSVVETESFVSGSLCASL